MIMTCEEFSNGFTTLLNNYSGNGEFGTQDPIILDEYEKSLLLTNAQEDLVVNLYTGRESGAFGFEKTEELRRYLSNLVRTAHPNLVSKEGLTLNNSYIYQLPPDLMYITLEQVNYEDEKLGCYNNRVASVYPVTQDEYDKVKRNPFRGPTKYKVIRLDIQEDRVELISNFNIKDYLIRYLSKPSPIILEDLEGVSINGESKKTECALNPLLHNTILERAVQTALRTKSIGLPNRERGK